jgi:predicted hotdog family 3-hydroxylacyl-ACP dehydratase
VIDRNALLALIPHQLGMCLLDGVQAWDDTTLHAVSGSHRHPANPLRRDGRLSALHLCEYGAQAMAVHGGLLAARAGGRAKAGMLVSLRGVELRCERIDTLPGRLDVHATLLQAGEASQQYEFRIEHAGELLASGRAAVMLQPEQA